MGWKINHFGIALIVAFALSMVTFIATHISGNWNTQSIYNIIFITFFNFTILSLNALLFTRTKFFLGKRAQKLFRISFIIIYSLIYVIATLGFIRTGQTTRIQTLLFLSQMQPLIMTSIVLGGIVLCVFILITILYKTSSITPVGGKERITLRIIFYISLALFGLTVLIDAYYLQLDEPILGDKVALAEYKPEILDLRENVLDINFTIDKPNVIFILLESITAERVGYHGYERNVTPNLDTLAKKSIVFSNAYATATHSDYAQPGVLSSRYLLTSKYRTISADSNPRKFLWDILKEDNYTTGYHSAQDDEWQNMDTYLDYTNLDNYTNSRTDGKTDYGSGWQKKDFDYRATERALNWLNVTIEKEEPFFLYMNFQATHQPYIYPENYSFYKPDKDQGIQSRGKDIQNIYDNSLRYVDAEVGRILDFLEENNETNNTVIIITSDHGHDLNNEHQINEHGNSIYDEELIIPALFFFPGIEHQIIEDRVSNIDIIPTIIDILRYDIPNEFQGEVMKKGRPIFLITQSNKYLIGMILNDTKIIADMNREILEIYELDEDPEELNNIAYSEEYKDKILRLLLWDYCQKDYYTNERWDSSLNEKCESINNFRM